jgi:hypothetical protein
MSEVKTETYEGQVYQIGSVYEFSDDGVKWELDYLLAVGSNPTFPFEAKKFEWELIREANYVMGTITTAPVELIDGNAYMFDYDKNSKVIVGVYNQGGESFLTRMGILRPWNVTNIRLMTVEEK